MNLAEESKRYLAVNFNPLGTYVYQKVSMGLLTSSQGVSTLRKLIEGLNPQFISE